MSTSGLDQCACKRGFFTLRDCSNAATSTCSICSRRVCDEHLAPRVDTKVCVECAARQAEGGAAGAGRRRNSGPAGIPGETPAPRARAATLERLDPTSAAVRWRSRYYRSYNYQPMWWGTYDPYWDDYGYRWYGDDNDDDGGGFGDS